MITDVDPGASSTAPSGRAGRQMWLLLFIFGTGILALIGGVVLADVVFPEPTMWRLPVMVAVFAAAAAAVRGRFRQANPDGRGSHDCATSVSAHAQSRHPGEQLALRGRISRRLL